MEIRLWLNKLEFQTCFECKKTCAIIGINTLFTFRMFSSSYRCLEALVNRIEMPNDSLLVIILALSGVMKNFKAKWIYVFILSESSWTLFTQVFKAKHISFWWWDLSTSGSRDCKSCWCVFYCQYEELYAVDLLCRVWKPLLKHVRKESLHWAGCSIWELLPHKIWTCSSSRNTRVTNWWLRFI